MPSQCVVCSAAIPPTTASLPSSGCAACVGRLLGLLDDIELMAPELDTGRRGTADAGPRRPNYGPRIEVDLTVLAFLDPRTLPTPDDPIRSLVGTLQGINDAIREQRGDQVPPAPLLYREIAYLRSVATWCATRDDFDELLADVRDLHRQVRLLTRDDRPQSVGRCPNVVSRLGPPCGTRLEVWPDDDRIECSTCGGCWDRAEYLQLAQTVLGYRGHVVRHLVDRPTLALLSGRSENVIRRHCTVVRYDKDGAALYDAIDAQDKLSTIPQRGRRDTPPTVVDTSP